MTQSFGMGGPHLEVVTSGSAQHSLQHHHDGTGPIVTRSGSPTFTGLSSSNNSSNKGRPAALSGVTVSPGEAVEKAKVALTQRQNSNNLDESAHSTSSASKRPNPVGSSSNHNKDGSPASNGAPLGPDGNLIFVDKPGSHDVLLGRGGGTNNHSGNIRFRKLVNEHKLRYLSSNKVEKPNVARDVVEIWRSMSPPGRFLARYTDGESSENNNGSGNGGEGAEGSDGGSNPTSPGTKESNLWYEVGDKRAREKASQCLRERTPEVLPFIKKIRAEQDALTEEGMALFQAQQAARQRAQHGGMMPSSMHTGMGQLGMPAMNGAGRFVNHPMHLHMQNGFGNTGMCDYNPEDPAADDPTMITPYGARSGMMADNAFAFGAAGGMGPPGVRRASMPFPQDHSNLHAQHQPHPMAAAAAAGMNPHMNPHMAALAAQQQRMAFMHRRSSDVGLVGNNHPNAAAFQSRRTSLPTMGTHLQHQAAGARPDPTQSSLRAAAMQGQQFGVMNNRMSPSAMGASAGMTPDVAAAAAAASGMAGGQFPQGRGGMGPHGHHGGGGRHLEDSLYSNAAEMDYYQRANSALMQQQHQVEEQMRGYRMMQGQQHPGASPTATGLSVSHRMSGMRGNNSSNRRLQGNANGGINTTGIAMNQINHSSMSGGGSDHPGINSGMAPAPFDLDSSESSHRVGHPGMDGSRHSQSGRHQYHQQNQQMQQNSHHTNESSRNHHNRNEEDDADDFNDFAPLPLDEARTQPSEDSRPPTPPKRTNSNSRNRSGTSRSSSGAAAAVSQPTYKRSRAATEAAAAALAAAAKNRARSGVSAVKPVHDEDEDDEDYDPTTPENMKRHDRSKKRAERDSQDRDEAAPPAASVKATTVSAAVARPRSSSGAAAAASSEPETPQQTAKTPTALAAAARAPSVVAALSQQADEEGEMTIEEYRRQLEAYMNKQSVMDSAQQALNNDDDDDSDLEDDWEREKDRAYRSNRQHRKRERGVSRNVSGASFMSTESFKSNLSMLSGMSLLSSQASDLNSREHKMNMNRSISSNLSLMSELTDMSQNLEDLRL